MVWSRPKLRACSPTIAAVLPDDNAISVSLYLNRQANREGGDRVFVPVEGDQAGLRHRGGDRMKAVEAAGDGNQVRPLRLKHLPDRPVLELGMMVGLGVSHTPAEKPIVQLREALYPHLRREEALAYQANLVLDLSLLPTRCRVPGRGLDQIMAAHLPETPVERKRCSGTVADSA